VCVAAQDFGAATLPFALDGSLDGFPLPGGDVDFLRFTGTPNTAVRVDLEGQATGKGTLSDPFLGLFDSGCNLITTSDDNGVNLNSRLTATIPSDGVYILAVTACCDGGFNQGGNGTYQLNIQQIVAPPNDDFNDATLISALPLSDPVDVTIATTEVGETTPSCAIPFGSLGRTAWYTFTPTQTKSILASTINAAFPVVVAAYTGNSLATLTEVSCREGSTAFTAQAGTTYHFQVGGLFDQGGLLEFRLEETPPPVAGFGTNPFDPSLFDVVQFFDFSFDPAGLGIQSQQWQFGDGATGTGCCPTHQYAADGVYSVHLTVTTVDGRTGSTSQATTVRTHDVAITKLTAPTSASAGQTRAIVVGIKNKRYPETVEVQLLKGVPGGFQQVAVVTQFVPLSSGNRTTDFSFSYTFTAADAKIGKVTFKAIANVVGGRDALPADNEAIAAPTKVSAGSSLAGAIVYHSDRDGDGEIFAINADGSGDIQLTHNTDHDIEPVWSPDGKRIAFNTFHDGSFETVEIYVMNADGTGITRLTNNAVIDFGPTWSPDGTQLAFTSTRDGDEEVFIMKANGTGVRQLTHNDGVSDVPTGWSPNGRQILFRSNRDGDNDFYVMNVDGSGVTQLTDNPASDEGDHATWSPDGKRIVFSSTRDGGDLDIFTMNPDGSGVTQLTANDGVDDDDPAWSPDGKHIAFHSTRTGREEVFVMNPDGTEVTQVTFNSGAVPSWRARPLP
jgi:Tol biopolymer transport system component